MTTKAINITNAVLIAIGSLSLFDLLMAIFGLVAILLAIALNVYAIKTKAAERKKHKAETELAKYKLAKLQKDE